MELIDLSLIPANTDDSDIPDENIPQLDQYFAACEIASTNGAKYMIPNDDEFRSQITSSHIFRTTTNELLVFTGGFRKNINDDRFKFIENLEACLKRCEKVDIIVDNICNTNVTQVIMAVAKERPDNIRLYQAKENTKDELQTILRSLQRLEKKELFKTENPNYHFIIGDSTRYRLEYNKDEKLAKVYFNDPDDANELKNVFNYVKTNLSVPFRYSA